VVDSESLLNFGALNGILVIVYGEFWRLLSGMFLHGGLLHIAFNMLSLWFVGRVVESWINGYSYLVIYFISGVIGGLLSIYFHPDTVAIGASGAIFGIFGAMGGFVFANRERLIYFENFLKEFGVILLLNLFIGIIFDSVDLSAHIGGLVAGFIGGLMVGVSKRLTIPYLIISLILIILFYEYLESIFYKINSILN